MPTRCISAVRPRTSRSQHVPCLSARAIVHSAHHASRCTQVRPRTVRHQPRARCAIQLPRDRWRRRAYACEAARVGKRGPSCARVRECVRVLACVCARARSRVPAWMGARLCDACVFVPCSDSVMSLQGHAVSLRFRSAEQCVFDREETREIEVRCTRGLKGRSRDTGGNRECY
jgi:hypothetical protein